MHLIRIDFIDKKYTLISTIEIKNALELMMGGVGGGGGGGGGEEEIRIKAGRSRSSLYRDDLPTIKAGRSRSSLYRDDLPTMRTRVYLKAAAEDND